MPIYEYKCRNCNEKFEVRRNLQDEEKEVKCPRCESRDTQRVFSLFSSGSSGNLCPPAPSRFGFG
ncbi:MAG TPA: zinc ribbon domain-containing protein [Dehalococcoidia bacterium]|nr:zinc ribbon domain-containing protein [Dehalococcoidia bacterium]